MLRFARLLSRSATRLEKNPLIHENGLYYGKFTKEEYEEARKFVTTQYEKLQQEIKGTHNVRENIGKMPQFPAQGPSRSVQNLSDFFSETIKTTGPVSLSAYMRQCLTHPDFGYYTTRDPLAAGGDFITSPEISSVFGEMIGMWLFSVWQAQGSPQKIQVVEFGPGRGTLIHDAMAVFNRFAKVSVSIVLIEASPVLRKEQAKLLCPGVEQFEKVPTPENPAGFDSCLSKWGHRVMWVDTEKDVPSEVSYVVAHEFFDALPIKSFVRKEEGWRELLVDSADHRPALSGLESPAPADSTSDSTATDTKLSTSDTTATSDTATSDSGSTSDGPTDSLFLTTAPRETPSSAIPSVSPRFRDVPVGSRVEICPDAELYLSRIVELVKNGQNAGAALIIDYGLANEIPSNSLRGIYKHKFVSPFFSPGNVDLSVDVDFENLRLLAAPHVDVFGPTEQGDFLHELGIGVRFDQLIQRANSMANKESLYESYVRLTGKDENSMGKIYKFLALLPKNSTRPAGFGTD
ncbi:putative arginine methyltransferase [Clavispora lusitaniae]|uniref:Arginine methyltransferase n=1 Tax=Clavispora lusitaniae TaxID=36911 RepID=A0ACD0WDL3_CLALS|nr:putative arginine methyltransferase [Clavispora lusitaniae]QFZ31152.1 putative arginine methyltransferase [Clavispora lusitaniae]QFZ36820.1 putative arginine methyltransferase [Clavispora lusitaniae]QFZ42504.1 putative arginine methyltransferase [Clavispora lusitaniae]QFZ48180.1 putative arginine methyltransferase [Clavispora lusitaniae]